MVQSVAIPLSWANNIPGVSGIEDVEFRVPELDDILDVVVENTLDRTDVDEALGDFVDDVADEIDVAAGTIDAIVEGVVERLDFDDIGPVTVDIEGSLFDVEQDLIVFFAEVLEEAGLDFDVPDLDLSEVTDPLESLTESVDDIEVPTIADITAAAEDGAETALDDVLPEWLTLSLTDAAARLLGDGLDAVVNDDVQQNLTDLRQELQE